MGSSSKMAPPAFDRSDRLASPVRRHLSHLTNLPPPPKREWVEGFATGRERNAWLSRGRVLVIQLWWRISF